MPDLRDKLRARPIATAMVIVAVMAVALVGLLGAAKATDRPAFCRAACHEMAPYANAWTQGPHASVGCVDCHVAPGQTARLTHKVAALKEVWAHVRGE